MVASQIQELYFDFSISIDPQALKLSRRTLLELTDLVSKKTLVAGRQNSTWKNENKLLFFLTPRKMHNTLCGHN
jgi:hypothetical protein